MKTLIVFFIAVLLSTNYVSANHLSGELQIINPQHGVFSVQIDHGNFKPEASTHIFRNISAGKHFIKLAEINYDRFGRRNINIFNQQEIYIEPGMRNIAVLNAYDELVVVQRERINNHTPVVCGTVQVNPYPVPPIPVQPIGLSEHEFNQFLSMVNRQSFESTRLNLMKNFIQQNNLNSHQVRRLMQALTFESSKLRIAKLAYSSVIDPNNYYVVNDAFTFESSIRQLNRVLYG